MSSTTRAGSLGAVELRTTHHSTKCEAQGVGVLGHDALHGKGQEKVGPV